MAVTGTFRLEGGPELLRKLQTLEKRISKKIVRQAMRESAKVIQAKAKQLAPVDTGLLKSAIKVRAAKKRRKNIISINVITGAGDYKGKTFYGSFLEYGHRRGKRTAAVRRARRLGHSSAFDDRPWVAPKPHLRPAFESKKEEAVQVATDRIRSGIREATA